MESINYDPERKLDRSQMEELATNKYLEKGLNVIFVGASGCGKTWLSNALGIHACRDRKTVLYIRLPELFSKFEENCHHSINSETPEHENRGLFFECADSFILKPAEDHEHVFLSSRNTLGIQTVKKTVVSDLMNP